MSEEILMAFMELFALIIKQDGGMLASERDYVVGFLKKQLTSDSVIEYLSMFDKYAGPVVLHEGETIAKAPSVRDSVKILGICKKINRTLNQEQKIVVLVRLYELVNSDQRYTVQRMNIINTVAEVFKISIDEVKATERFVKLDNPGSPDFPSILSLVSGSSKDYLSNRVDKGSVVSFLRIESVGIYFLKYISEQQLFLNGLQIRSGQVYSFAKGSTLKSHQGNTIYYSDINSRYLSDVQIHKLSFIVKNLTFDFNDGHTAVDNVSFSVDEGKLVGILGASGSGKTTLLNLLCGVQRQTSGSIKINGLDVQKDKKKLEGVLGYVPQDDLLIDDLTIFENLYYAACQCFDGKSKQELTELSNHLLMSIGLYEKRNLKVGTPLNKVISGGQRKRLNIALELIREPSILFLDEPTSGLSSSDSENLMNLLRDLTFKGKLVFNVIHQPSSAIYKMFDKVIILDQEGEMAYFGNPVDAVVYFKTIESQINAAEGECPTCGNVNTETIFNILETQVVDEFGQYTDRRKVSPKEWSLLFKDQNINQEIPEIKESPHNDLQRPNALRQFLIYFVRDVKSKLANKQYILLTLLEAPVLGVILSFLIRYIADPDSNVYIFAENENIPIYIFMTVIVALFLGLIISAEEIFKDRKILKRERFLNLNRSSYLLSKILVLTVISAMQAALFVLIANNILGLHGLFAKYWIAFFATAFGANMLGLNISVSFNSAITIYIIIPLLIIPMMVLSGAMFSFDKLNRKIGNIDKVPLMAEFMPTRWTYEALMVAQFKDNRYSSITYNENGETLYDIQKHISNADFNKVYRIPELKVALEECKINSLISPKDEEYNTKLLLIRNEIEVMEGYSFIPECTYKDYLKPDKFDTNSANSILEYLNKAYDLFNKESNAENDKKDNFFNVNEQNVNNYQKEYYNYKLEEILTKYYERHKVLEHNNRLIQNVDLIYLDPVNKGGLKFRTHFYAPTKCIFGMRIDTFTFNIVLVLLVNILLYVTLFYEILGRILTFFGRFKLIK